MEMLESVGPRPRHARYQAALRLDKLRLDSSLFREFASSLLGPAEPLP